MNQYQQGYAPQGGYAPPQYPQQPQQAPQDNLYVGSAKLRQAPFGPVMRVSLSRADIEKLLAHMNEQGWVSIDIKERRTPSPTGSTHYGEIDLWQPQQAQGGYAPQGQYAQPPQQPPQYRQAPPPPPPQGYRPAPAQGQYRQAPPPQYRQAPPPQGYRPPQGQPPPPPQGQGYDDGGFQPQGQPPAPAPQPQGQYAPQPQGQPPAAEQHRYGPEDCNLGPEGQLYDADGNPLF